MKKLIKQFLLSSLMGFASGMNTFANSLIFFINNKTEEEVQEIVFENREERN